MNSTSLKNSSNLEKLISGIKQIWLKLKKLKYVLACHIITSTILNKISFVNCSHFQCWRDDCQRKDIDEVLQLSNNTIYRRMHVNI